MRRSAAPELWPALRSAAAESERPISEPPPPPRSQSPRHEAGGTVSSIVQPRELDEVVQRAQRGDAAAFRELFRRHRSAVAAIAYRMLGPTADLEDVVQEVFLQVHRSLPDFRNQSKFSTWLHRVAVNVVLMARRRARSRPALTPVDDAQQEPADAPLPEDDVSRGRRLAAFRRLLDKLSEKKRTVFVLHELEGMAPGDIAKMVDCPVLTVRTRLFYARRELAEMMRAEPSLASLVESFDEPLRGNSAAASDDAVAEPTPPRRSADGQKSVRRSRHEHDTLATTDAQAEEP
jgi:RNA polymerase sigma-70 factor, ECF subfamily